MAQRVNGAGLDSETWDALKKVFGHHGDGIHLNASSIPRLRAMGVASNGLAPTKFDCLADAIEATGEIIVDQEY